MSCPICIRDNIRGAFSLKCGHIFCTLCVYEWKEFGGTTCPMCRNDSVSVYESPHWRISNMDRPFEKGDNPELNENEIKCIQDEFDIILYRLSNLDDNYRGRICIVRMNSITLGTIEADSIKDFFENCIAIQRENGVAYPCFPRNRFVRTDDAWFYGVNIN